MKTLRNIMILVFLQMTVNSCYIDHWFDCVDGRGGVISEDFNLNAFTELRLALDADVYLLQGDEHRIQIEAQPNIIDEIDFRIRNGVLTIGRDRCIRDHKKIEIYLTLIKLESLSNSGSGDIYSDSNLDVGYIDLNISGSGNVELNVEGTQINSHLSGSGDLRLWGSVDRIYHSVSGSGDLNAFGLDVNEAHLNVSGSGDSEVNVYEYLDVNISGSGNVYFIGNPEIHSRISGSGQLIEASSINREMDP